MLVLHQLAVPAQDGVWADDKPYSTQDGSGQGGQERRQEEAILRGESHPYIGAELPLQDHDLVTQGENLDILSRSLIGSNRNAANAFVTAR